MEISYGRHFLVRQEDRLMCCKSNTTIDILCVQVDFSTKFDFRDGQVLLMKGAGETERTIDLLSENWKSLTVTIGVVRI